MNTSVAVERPVETTARQIKEHIEQFEEMAFAGSL